MTYIALFFGGGLGSICRFLLSRYNLTAFTPLPWGTIAANILSCLVLGYVTAMLAQKPEGEEWLRPFFAVGFCGGFSTFSTFGFETLHLLREGLHFYAFLNIAISLTVCLSAIYGGFLLYRFMN